MQAGLLETLSELLEAKLLLHLLKHDLDKDSRTACGIFLVHVDDRHGCPADTVSRKEVAKKPGNVSQSICLVAMDGIVVVTKTLRKCIGPFPMQLAEAFAHVAVEFAVGTLLRATFDNHVAELNVLAFRHLKFEQLVHALFKVE